MHRGRLVSLFFCCACIARHTHPDATLVSRALGPIYGSSAKRPFVATMTSAKESKKTRRFKPIKTVGRGACATVIAAFDSELVQVVAIKRPTDPTDKTSAERAQHEFRMHCRMRRLNLTFGVSELLYAFRTPKTKSLALVFPLNDSTLWQMMAVRESVSSVQEAASIVHPLLQLLAAWKKHNLVHADLTPANIMLTWPSTYENKSPPHLSVIDLGLARFINGKETWSDADDRYLQTVHYRAPEVAVQAVKFYGPAMDMWSVGCILVDLLQPSMCFRSQTGLSLVLEHMAWLGKYPDDLIDAAKLPVKSLKTGADAKGLSTDALVAQKLPRKHLKSYESTECSEKLHAQLCDLVGRMLTLDPRKRIEPDDALKHPFFLACFPQLSKPATDDDIVMMSDSDHVVVDG